MKTQLIILCIVLVATLACGQSITVGTLADSPPLVATSTATKTPVKIATKNPTSTPTPEMVFIHGSYNLRPGPVGSGDAYGHISNELVTLIRTHANGWMYIQTDERTGWVSPLAKE